MTTEEPTAYRAVVEQLLAGGDVSETQMMGMPALKANGKMFGGRVDEELVLRLGRDRVDQLLAAGRARQFDPSGRGRPMRDWAVLPVPADDWAALAAEAKRFTCG